MYLYSDYCKDVMLWYRSITLPPRLILPTAADIRDECLAVCQIRFDKKDLPTLTGFFGVESDQAKMIRIIDRCDPDRFKPLAKFLKGETQKTSKLNIELLAWLIDFPQRPFKLGAHTAAEVSENTSPVKKIEIETIKAAEEEVLNNAIGENKSGGNKTGKRFLIFSRKQKQLLAAYTLLLTALASVFITKRDNFLNPSLSQKELVTGVGYMPITSAGKSPINLSTTTFSRCTGDVPCKACSNCRYCNWCNSGGTCSICSSQQKKTVTQKRSAQCKAITKKGTQCSRAAKAGLDYCWQHGR